MPTSLRHRRRLPAGGTHRGHFRAPQPASPFLDSQDIRIDDPAVHSHNWAQTHGNEQLDDVSVEREFTRHALKHFERGTRRM